MESSSVTFENYLNIRSAYSPEFDPSGNRIAFLSDISGVPQVWSIDLNGGEPTQLTSFEDRFSSIDYSPDGKFLLFTMDNAGNERHQLYLIDDDSEIISLTENPEVMHVYGAWSSDGKAIAYASNERNRAFFDIYVRDIPDGTARRVFEDDGSNTVEAWSPDGNYLVISQSRTSLYNHLILLDLQTGDSTKLTSDELAAYHNINWSADSKSLFLTTNKGGDFLAIGLMNVETGDISTIAEHPWDIEAIGLSPAGDSIAYVVNEAGYSRLLIHDLDTGEAKPVKGLPPCTLQNGRGSASVAWSSDGQRLAFTVNGPTHNPDVWVYDVSRTSSKQLTHSDTGGVERESFVLPELISFDTFDGLHIPAFLYSPKGASPDGSNTVLVHVHGGPEGQDRPGFNAIYQYFVQRGYCVLAPNVRGSTGYGVQYVHLDDVRKRMDSVRDLEYAHKWLIESGWANPKRAAIMGGSYGGFMTLAAITSYPELWAAAVELYGIGDFLTFFENTSSYRRKLRATEYGDPEKDGDFLREISPIHYVDRIRAPLMVLHGAMDPRVPISETEQMIEAMNELGKVVEYVRFEDEGHGFVKRQNRLKAYPAIAGFLDKHLGM